MSKKMVGCGCLIVVIIGVIIGVAGVIPKKDTAAPLQPIETQMEETVSAELSDYYIDGDDFVFTLIVKNLTDTSQIVYAVVFGENLEISPPRRRVWPPAVNSTPDRSRRGMLSSHAISRNWQSRTEHQKGAKCDLMPNEEEILEGALYLDSTSPHAAWEGETIDPRAQYNEIYLWVFSQSGQLIFEKQYNVQ